jgi:hypothetical protein
MFNSTDYQFSRAAAKLLLKLCAVVDEKGIDHVFAVTRINGRRFPIELSDVDLTAAEADFVLGELESWNYVEDIKRGAARSLKVTAAGLEWRDEYLEEH